MAAILCIHISCCIAIMYVIIGDSAAILDQRKAKPRDYVLIKLNSSKCNEKNVISVHL